MSVRSSFSRTLVAAIGLLVLALAPRALAALPDGAPAPAFTIKDLSGENVASTTLAPRSMVLIFGELTSEGTRQTSGDVVDTLAEQRLAGLPVVPVLIISQDAPDTKLKEYAAVGRYPALILHDLDRETFTAYHILVAPTVFVVDPAGKVVHSMPGFAPNFREILAQSVLLAAGKTTRAELDKALDAKSVAAPQTIRADRLVQAARELMRQSLYTLAATRLSEAIKLAPDHLGAQLARAELMLRQDRLPEADAAYAAILAAHPDSTDAALGVAAIQIRRAPSGDQLAAAEASLSILIAKNPSLPRAHQLLGSVYEQRGEAARAAAEYKKAAELALDR